MLVRTYVYADTDTVFGTKFANLEGRGSKWDEMLPRGIECPLCPHPCGGSPSHLLYSPAAGYGESALSITKCFH